MTKKELKNKVVEALQHYNGKAKLIDVSKFIWANNKDELESSGDIFFTWQYDVRWAAQALRKDGVMKPFDKNSNYFWELEDNE